MAVIIECQGSTPSNSSSMEMTFIDIFRGDPLVVYLMFLVFEGVDYGFDTNVRMSGKVNQVVEQLIK